MSEPIVYTSPAAAVTNEDFHTRRDGEPLGHEPQMGERIRYAMRHTAWDVTGQRVEPGTDAQGPWSEPVIVSDIFIASNTGDLTCRRHHRTGGDSWITLDWWICKPAPVDGTLF